MDPLAPWSCTSILSTFTSMLPKIMIIIVLILLSAFFSAAETAFSSCNRVKIKIKAEDGHRSAKRVMKTLDNMEKTVITVLIGNNIVNVLISTLSTIISINLLKSEGIGTLVATIIATIVVLIFGEIVPKNIAKAHNYRLVLLFVYPIQFLIILFYPISLLFTGILWLFKKLFRVKDVKIALSEIDFQDIVESIEETGEIDEEESEIIQAAVEWSDQRVKDVITPADQMVAFDINQASKTKTMQFLQNVEYSRIPVYQGDINHIIGILHVRSYLKQMMGGKNFSFKNILTEPIFVSPQWTLDEMFDVFKAKKTHLAIVQNSDGTILGMVTMEDVLEKLVGEIDETDIPLEEGGVLL